MIYKRTQVIVLSIFFAMAAAFYMHLVFSFSREVSFLDTSLLVEELNYNWEIFILLLLSLWLVFRVKKIAVVFYSLYLAVLNWQCFSYAFMEYSKMLLILNSAFLVLSLIAIIFLVRELFRAYYSESRTPGDFLDRTGAVMPARITLGEQVFSARLLNWDDDGVFAELELASELWDGLAEQLPCELALELKWGERSFKMPAMPLYGVPNLGLGLSIAQNPQYNEFYKQCKAMGFLPALLN